MAENRLGIGKINFPQSTPVDLQLALEDLNRRLEDNISWLLAPMIKAVSSTYTAEGVDHTLLGDASGGDFTISLPEAGNVEGKVLVLKNVGASGTLTIDPSGSETIDGASTHGLAGQYDSIMIQSDGSNWHILADK